MNTASFRVKRYLSWNSVCRVCGRWNFRSPWKIRTAFVSVYFFRKSLYLNKNLFLYNLRCFFQLFKELIFKKVEIRLLEKLFWLAYKKFIFSRKVFFSTIMVSCHSLLTKTFFFISSKFNFYWDVRQNPWCLSFESLVFVLFCVIYQKK